MLNKLLDDFKKEKKVDILLINEYAGKIPEELIEIWTEVGFGTFYDGYLKIVNPHEYKELIDETYFRGIIAVPILVTAFGDIICWEENKYVSMVKYKNGDIVGMCRGFDFYLDDIATGVYDEIFEMSQYREAVQLLGEPLYDECFGYVPLLGLGGSKDVHNLRRVKTREHIEIITQLVGKIGM